MEFIKITQKSVTRLIRIDDIEEVSDNGTYREVLMKNGSRYNYVNESIVDISFILNEAIRPEG